MAVSNALINSNFYKIATANATTGIPVDLGLAGNITTGGNLAAGGNLAVGNGAPGTGNITAVAPGVFSGNGALLTNITASNLASGSSNVLIPLAGGNVNTSVGGVANVFVVTSTGANINGTANATGAISTTSTDPSTSTSTGALIVAGGAGIAGNAYIGGNADVASNVVAGTNVQAGNAVITDVVLGRTTALTLQAGGTNQDVILKPSGSGNVTIASPETYLTGLKDPLNPADATNKRYVDTLFQGLKPKEAVAVGTFADLGGTYNNGTDPLNPGLGATITLGAALTTLDGYTLLDGDRILVKNQATTAENGIYTWASATPTVLTRALDYDAAAEMLTGVFVFCKGGTTNGSFGFVQTSDDVATVGTSAVTFTIQSAPISYTAGTGLTLTGTQFYITDTAVTPGTYGNSLNVPQITVNQQGQITSAVNVAVGLSQIANTTSNVSIPVAAGNVNTSVGGVANVLVVTTTGANVTGTADITGNTAVGANLTVAGNANVAGTSNVVGDAFFGANANITGIATVTGNANIAGNINATGNIIVAGNANVFIPGGTAGQVLVATGIGGSLAWVTASMIANGTSNVSIPVADGNVNTSVGGVANVVVVTTTGANVAGTANVVGDAFFGANANVAGTANVVGDAFLGANANVVGNINAAGNIIVAGNANLFVPGGTAGQVLAATGAVGGNLQWTTISTDRISNGTSNVAIPVADGNVLVGVGGVANVVVVSTTGANVTGTANISGITDLGANLNVVGNVNATGNIIVAGVANVFIPGGTAGQILAATGAAGGNLQWSNTVSPTAIQEFTATAAGTNQTFTLTNTALTTTSSSVYVNGVLLRTGQYSVAGTTLTVIANLSSGDLVTVGAIPGAVISSTVTGLAAPSVASFTVGGGTPGAVLSTDGAGIMSWTNTVAATATQEFVTTAAGAGQTFTLSNTNLTNTNSSVYVNGVLIRAGASNQYTISGTTLTVSRVLAIGDVITVGAIPGAVVAASNVALTFGSFIPPAASINITVAVGTSTPATAVTLMQFTLPSAGTWEVMYQVRGFFGATSGSVGIFTGATGGTVVDGSQTFAAFPGGGACATTFVSRVFITTTGSALYSVRGWNTGAGNWTAMLNSTTDGASTVTWVKIA